MELPLFERPFRKRVRDSWETFVKGEEKLRKLIDKNTDSDVIVEHLDTLLTPAFEEIYAEVGFNGEKYDLILNLEGDWSRLFPLTYFKNHAPKEVLKHWNILVGRQSREQEVSDYKLNIGEESVCAKDIQVWIAWEENVKVSVYCEKLLPLLQERECEAYWIVYMMLDYAIGELAEMKYIDEMEILTVPYKEKALTLEQLLPYFMDKLSLSKEELFDANRYCELYSSYQMEPVEGADDGLRKDVFAGSTCFVPVLNDFLRGETRVMDRFHKDGIVAGYFCFPVYGFQGENRGAQILDFRDNVVAMIEKLAGADNFTFIGGASGIYYGYIDFIAWDLKAVLDVAVSIFEKSEVDWAFFHSFREDVGGIMLFEK